MREYTMDLLHEIKRKEKVEMINDVSTIVKYIPDEQRLHVMDPRVLKIAQKKKKRIDGLQNGYSLSSQRYRPDKISYDLTTTTVHCEERLIPIGDHMIDIYIYIPETKKETYPACIFFHGGAFVAGDMRLYANQMKYICEQSEAIVIFPEYRLAPENPYPAQIEDGMGTIEWVVQHADEYAIDIQRVMIAGDSAGGSLVNSCLLKDDRGYIKKAFEIYPGVDSTPLDKLQMYIWSYDAYPIIEEQKEWAYSRIDKIKKPCEKDPPVLYLQNKVNYDYPEVSIVYASQEQLKKLPPIILAYSEYDYLKISNQYFAKVLTELQNNIRVLEYKGCDHGFLDCLGIVVQAEDLCLEIACELNRW